MTTVDPVSSTQSSSGASAATASASNANLDYDAFLSLLVAQLRNQDPTEPTDNAQLMSQLASFSSVEQQIQINDKLTALITSNALGDASNLIGKTITSADGSNSGKVTSVIVTSDGVSAELEDGNRISVEPGTKISSSE